MAATIGPEESMAYGSVGKLASHLQGKIVVPATGEALGPGQRGELWIRGPLVMKGEPCAAVTWSLLWTLSTRLTFDTCQVRWWLDLFTASLCLDFRLDCARENLI